MSYTKPRISYKGTFSGQVTSNTADFVVNLVDGAGNPVVAGAIAFHFVSECSIRLNDEVNSHTFEAGDKFTFSEIAINKFTIVENGASVNFSGQYVA
jgi:hypothetical protein